MTVEKFYETFDFDNAIELKVHNGFILRVLVEDTDYCGDNYNPYLSDVKERVNLSTGGKAIIELVSGDKILITNSEWVSLFFQPYNQLKP
jgi:hypothetical protein